MSNPNVKPEKAASSSSFSTLFASILIPVAIIIGFIVFIYHSWVIRPILKIIILRVTHIPGNYLGMMYKGGYLVPVLMGLMMIVISL